MPLTESQCAVGPDQGGRIDRIVQTLTSRSRAEVRGLFDHGCVRLNGEICPHAGALVAEGDLVVVRQDPRTRYRPKRPRPEEAAPPGAARDSQPGRSRRGPFRLVFEDRELIVVDKAPGALTVPTDRGESNSLLDALGRLLHRRGHRGRLSVVHRLDRGTSGLLVFGKNPRVARELIAQFRVHKADREYGALVAGRVSSDAGTFESRLGTTRSLRRYSVAAKKSGGERAVTHYRIEQRLADATYVRVTLETGKRNQIRVHFAEAGHPVLGDERYAVEAARHPAWRHKRLALHAMTLGFEHPRTRERLRFESPIPAEFESFLAQARR
jgi:23S rRNA pseudouridine1911/1915/1917 synthase